MPKPSKRRPGERLPERRLPRPGRASHLPAVSLIGKKQMQRLLAAKEAAIHEMQGEFGSPMSHFKIEEKIDGHYFPELLRGIETYLESRENRRHGKELSVSDEIHLSEGFDEHMRNWQNAIATKFTGPDGETVERFLRDFYTRFVGKLRPRGPAGRNPMLSD